MKKRSSWKRWVAPLLVGIAGCSEPLEGELWIGGFARIPEPVEGAEVAAWHVDERTGERGQTPAAVGRTDETGFFAVELAAAPRWPPGAVEIEVRGGAIGAIQLAPDRGVEVTLAGVAPGDDRWWVKATPLTSLGTALARGRLRHPRKEAYYSDAARTAYALIGDHFGDVSPSGSALADTDKIDASARSLTTPARHAVVLAALEVLAEDVADRHLLAADPPVFALTAAWAHELAGPDARFGGRADGGENTEAFCCVAPDAPRVGLSDAVVDYAARMAPDREPGHAIEALAVAIRENDHPELFGGSREAEHTGTHRGTR